MFSVSGYVTPDCTRTSTVPVPDGTTAVRCESSRTVTFVAAVLPKKTWRRPAAPEKFAPATVTVEPAAPDEELRPVTAGVRSTTSKSLKVRLFSPWVESWISLSFHVSARLLFASTE